MPRSLYRQYLHLARRLVRLDPRRPRQGNLRRAVSTAYYALFHFLIERSSRTLFGSTGDRERFRRVMARAYGHSEMASVSRTFRGGNLPAYLNQTLGSVVIPDGLKAVAICFLRLQDQRHLAEYDLGAVYSRAEVLGLISTVEQVIENWSTIKADPATRFYLMCLPLWDRLKGR